MEAFFKEIGTKIEKAVAKDAMKILKETGDEKVYAAALVTDSDCITLYFALNTYESMKKKDEYYIELLKDDLTEEEIDEVKKGTKSFTKWIPDEWEYSDGKTSEFVEVSRLLFEKEAVDAAAYEKYKALFFETVTSAFRNAIEAKVFGKYSDEITYFISISDDERTTEIENYSAKLLNSDKLCEEFVNRTENEM